jgi:hypothetical protein
MANRNVLYHLSHTLEGREPHFVVHGNFAPGDIGQLALEEPALEG